MTTFELVQYYAKLLIYQYVSKNKAYNTIISSATPLIMPQQSIQSISFYPSPTTGSFILSYDDTQTDSINWNDSTATIQTKLRVISGLGSISVTGSISSGLIINFVGVLGVAQSLTVFNNSLLSSSLNVDIVILETDLTLPLAVQNAFDIETAIGVQLDVLGKYVGVNRTSITPTRTIVLDDSDFRTLIKFAAIQNNAGSSLQNIENNLNLFFPNAFKLTDYKTMRMSYLFSDTIGSDNFFLALINEKLIPKPMAVGISIIPVPDITAFFGYSTYETNGINNSVKPYNTYEDFNNNWLYLQYQDFIF